MVMTRTTYAGLHHKRWSLIAPIARMVNLPGVMPSDVINRGSLKAVDRLNHGVTIYVTIRFCRAPVKVPCPYPSKHPYLEAQVRGITVDWFSICLYISGYHAILGLPDFEHIPMYLPSLRPKLPPFASWNLPTLWGDSWARYGRCFHRFFLCEKKVHSKLQTRRWQVRINTTVTECLLSPTKSRDV